MVHNTLYNQFYNFALLKAAAPLKGTIIEFAIYHAKKYEKQKMKKKSFKKTIKKYRDWGMHLFLLPIFQYKKQKLINNRS